MCWMDGVQEAVVLESERIHERLGGGKRQRRPLRGRDGHLVSRNILSAVEREVEEEFFGKGTKKPMLKKKATVSSRRLVRSKPH